MKNNIYVVGIGPGSLEHLSFRAYHVLKEVNVIIGHKTYVNLVKEYFPEKVFIKSGMKREVERCLETLEIAKSGKSVALISSGDAGVYGMAGIMLEIALDNGFNVEIIPGITSANASASVVGAPIMHDHATISLSDLLTDWELIKKRVDLASQGDFVISFYNPKSKSRLTQIAEAREIMLKHKNKDTVVAIVRNTGREGENHVLTSLENMLEHEIDMFTTVIVGNSKTFIKENKMITPRGYHY
ncbi:MULTISPECIES: precorrin-3B C(17)-methyltransferase [Sulfurospirillum]|uniref:Cobalt-precorrin-3b C17-methyltransferase CbiH n=4 Tax=Sulfurospirillum TaxID=57665 RepID=A0A1Y0HL32_9BACT|nr:MULTISPECIES: precorrin-3B C(17)-methyltransferase [Sulfurospirillum]AHJ12822.1 cobalt-precorrin-3b C17-methyltransferase CbiH [Sulfurospirillum multivorans DSM 12446]AOO65301.1 cobalt-precorrin-3b C17-methyltransferase CbiH [Sulfurospirillum halorespirans DSM 13726]ARU48782.1 cobalt-precorrin-3b C17-methyltransferase CbiH [Sulfurospirillum diekertiae]ASC93604.1 cobalt-precorrin-3b C17-methyltransferase CbiH [Sulfurospirillum diekertiae]ATB69648.1 cobalt-precorrin-3b C17-methyltransferase C